MRAIVFLILLHALDGHVVMINPAAVTSMHASEGKNEHVVAGVNCLINTSDGKFVSVVETCEKVRDLFVSPKADRL